MTTRLLVTLGLGIWGVIAFGRDCSADQYNVQININNQRWPKARIALDYTNSNGAINCVAVQNMDQDGKIRFFTSEGGQHNLADLEASDFPASLEVCDSLDFFYNNLIVDFDSLGTEISFDVEITPTTAGTSGAVDEFAFYVLGRDNLHPFKTADPLGANALFALSLSGDQTVDLTVFDPMTVSGDSLSLYLDSTIVGIEEIPPFEERLRLVSVSPNPASSRVRIVYLVPPPGGQVVGRIYDFQGRLVRTLFDRLEQPGDRTITWDGLDGTGRRVASGVYFLRLATAGHSVIRKVVLVR